MTPADDGIPMQLGRVEGRLGALEDRVGRHEKFVGDYLTRIDGKLDRALAAQEQRTAVTRLFRWAILVVTGASGWAVMLIRGHS
jgi:hypothetical protein